MDAPLKENLKMKKILLACDPSHIDPPLRRSLGHLLKSACQIKVAHNGGQVLDHLHDQAYDLIIIDFEIPGADSLELVESVQYIDPGVPVILMMQAEHRCIWDTACRLKTTPIIRPFKPLKFLRLVDKLLHQQLNRYRRLGETLTAALEGLCAQTAGPCAFLVEESGQVLMIGGEPCGWSIDDLGRLVAEKAMPAGEPVHTDHLAAAAPAGSPLPPGQECGLYVTLVTDHLRLALLSAPPGGRNGHLTWPAIDVAARQIRAAFYSHAAGDSEAALPQALATPHRFITLTLCPPACPPVAAPEPETQEEWDQEETAINWGIITNNSDLLSRLQAFCQIDR
jgi:CheY-like chemotaxis protein